MSETDVDLGKVSRIPPMRTKSSRNREKIVHFDKVTGLDPSGAVFSPLVFLLNICAHSPCRFSNYKRA